MVGLMREMVKGVTPGPHRLCLCFGTGGATGGGEFQLHRSPSPAPAPPPLPVAACSHVRSVHHRPQTRPMEAVWRSAHHLTHP